MLPKHICIQLKIPEGSLGKPVKKREINAIEKIKEDRDLDDLTPKYYTTVDLPEVKTENTISIFFNQFLYEATNHILTMKTANTEILQFLEMVLKRFIQKTSTNALGF